MVLQVHDFDKLVQSLAGWWCVLTILKNDGVRQWEGWHPIDEMENNPNVRNHQPVRDFPLRGTKLRRALESRMPQNLRTARKQRKPPPAYGASYCKCQQGCWSIFKNCLELQIDWAFSVLTIQSLSTFSVGPRLKFINSHLGWTLHCQVVTNTLCGDVLFFHNSGSRIQLQSAKAT